MSRARGRRPRLSPLALLGLLGLLGATALLAGGTLFARSSLDGAGATPAIQRTLETPGDAGRENDLGNQLLLAGDADGAEAAYRRAIEAAPDDATPRYNLGRLLLERGHRFSARRELSRAVELDPEHAEARYVLGMAYDDLGLDRLARSHYRRAFELEPSLTDPRRHPEVARRRQALSALLELWEREERPVTVAAAPVAGSAPAPRADGEAAPAGVESVEPPSESGGGYARVTGGERTDRSAGEVEGSQRGLGENGTRGPTARQSARGSRDTVIDPTDLRSGVSVNQIVAPGESQRGGRGTTTRPSSKSSRGFGSRFTPPQRPVEPPFDPDEESTGRIENQLLAPDDAPYAIAG